MAIGVEQIESFLDLVSLLQRQLLLVTLGLVLFLDARGSGSRCRVRWRLDNGVELVSLLTVLLERKDE